MARHWHIAQMNVGRAVARPTEPPMAAFTALLDEINALAEASPGFVWRLQSEQGNATDIQTSDDPRFIVNMSVWDSVEALFAFTYRSGHRDVMVRRREWFQTPAGAYQVLWWIPAGHRPTVEEGLQRLRQLDACGPSAEAFTFKTVPPAPAQPGGTRDLLPEPYCVGWS